MLVNNDVMHVHQLTFIFTWPFACIVSLNAFPVFAGTCQHKPCGTCHNNNQNSRCKMCLQVGFPALSQTRLGFGECKIMQMYLEKARHGKI